MKDPRTATDLVTVEIVTLLDANYQFPDVSEAALNVVLPQMSEGRPRGMLSLTLVNVSIATLVIPFRVIKRVLVDGEDWWIAPKEVL